MPITGLDHVQLAMPPGREADAEAFYAGPSDPTGAETRAAGPPGRLLVRARATPGAPRRGGGLPAGPQGPSGARRRGLRRLVARLEAAGFAARRATVSTGWNRRTWTIRSATGSSSSNGRRPRPSLHRQLGVGQQLSHPAQRLGRRQAGFELEHHQQRRNTPTRPRSASTSPAGGGDDLVEHRAATPASSGCPEAYRVTTASSSDALASSAGARHATWHVA